MTNIQEKNRKSPKGVWLLICEKCKQHKEDVQFRKPGYHWVCGDCYRKEKKRDKCLQEHIGESHAQWKRRKREKSSCNEVYD